MKKITQALLSMMVLTLMTACGGGGGSTSTGGVYFTHEELAKEFVRRMNIDEGYDLELVKDNTRQYDYVVVYDYDEDTYDAYYLGGYNVGEDLTRYLFNNNNLFYYDLDAIGGGLYEDYYTGIVFEKTQGTSKDLMKLAALEEAVQIKKSAEHIAAEYGLSVDRSMEVAKLSLQWKNTPKDRMTDADHDHYAQEILGYSISDYKQAAEMYAKGDQSKLKELVDGTAVHNGTTPEDVQDIINDVFQVKM